MRGFCREGLAAYRGASLTRNNPLLGPYGRSMSRAVGYLTLKKQPPPRTLHEDYVKGRRVPHSQETTPF